VSLEGLAWFAVGFVAGQVALAIALALISGPRHRPEPQEDEAHGYW
jgi:hypothetical protein